MLAGLPIEWHMIGHLQRNKVRRTLPLIGLLQSCDNLSLIEAVDQSGGRGDAGRIACPDRGQRVGRCRQTRFPACGRRALPGAAGGADRSGSPRPDVHGQPGRRTGNGPPQILPSLRKLRDQLRENCPENVRLDELSMGMSGDYEVAIEEGATIVRVGSALFEGIDP